MAVTVDTFGNLTAQQKIVMQAYFDLGGTLSLENRPVPTAGQTMQQARNVDKAVKELIDWLTQAQRGAQYIMRFRRQESADAFEASTQ